MSRLTRNRIEGGTVSKDAGPRKGSNMRISGSILTVVLLTLLASTPASAQVNDTYAIPAVAHQPGAAGTAWRSALHLFNPHTYTLVISVTFLRTHGEIGDEVIVELGPNESISTDDVLDEWFGTTGGGSLLLATFPEDNPGVSDDTISRSFVARSKTYNVTPTGGSYGQEVPGVWAGLLDFEFDGITSIAHGVTHSGVPGLSGFRTNVGGVNLGDETVVLLLTVYDSAGNPIADTFNQPLEFLLHPYAHEQQGLPIAGVDLTLEFLLDDPSQQSVVFPYVTVVDNRTGDAEFIHPTLLAAPSVLFNGVSGASRLETKSEQRGREITIDDARRARARTARVGTIRSEGGEVRVIPDRRGLSEVDEE